MKRLTFLFLILGILSCLEPRKATMRPQNPSPMVDYTRPHHRIRLDSVLSSGIPVDLADGIQGNLYVPAKWKNEKQIALVIHFHGDGRVAQYAIDQQPMPWALFHCHWGSGSSSYSRPIQNMGPAFFLETVLAAFQKSMPGGEPPQVFLSGWSAGYGAVRSIISDEKAAGKVAGILLLDGLHCSYVPEGMVMAEGARLDSTQMQPFVNWATQAVAGKKSFVFTHSTVFPGTFASTTETADHILQKLNLKRVSQLADGPVGMQQTSVAEKGRLMIISYAGNSAPDHVDHYHGMGGFLRLLSN